VGKRKKGNSKNNEMKEAKEAKRKSARKPVSTVGSTKPTIDQSDGWEGKKSSIVEKTKANFKEQKTDRNG